MTKPPVRKSWKRHRPLDATRQPSIDFQQLRTVAIEARKVGLLIYSTHSNHVRPAISK